jgi:CRP/FNR family transcriptional regulator, cyclic AMP receptor protein
MASSQLKSFLREASWAKGLSEEQYQRVDLEIVESKFAAGSIVSAEGQPAENWIGVVEGMVKVDTIAPDGKTTTFIGVSKGGWLGEGSLLKRELRPYEVVALRDSHIAFMPFSTFDWLFRSSLPFNHFLVRQLNARLGQFVEVVESIRMQNSLSQVALCISQLFNPQLGTVETSKLEISQDEIASLCGLSRPRTNIVLRELQDRGLIRTHYGGIQVIDIGGLRGLGRLR